MLVSQNPEGINRVAAVPSYQPQPGVLHGTAQIYEEKNCIVCAKQYINRRFTHGAHSSICNDRNLSIESRIGLHRHLGGRSARRFGLADPSAFLIAKTLYSRLTLCSLPTSRN